MKKNIEHSLQKRLITLLVACGMGATFMVNAPSLVAQNPKNKPCNKAKQTQHLRDSLFTANWDMFNQAQEKYFDRIDKKHTMGRFFNKREISELNKVITPYLATRAGDTDIDYKYAKVILPIKSSTPLSAFVDIVAILNVKPEDMAQFDMVFSNGCLYMFNDAKREKMFETYLDDCYSGCIKDEGIDFSQKEFARIRDEYLDNQRKIDSLNIIIRNAKRSH